MGNIYLKEPEAADLDERYELILGQLADPDDWAVGSKRNPPVR